MDWDGLTGMIAKLAATIDYEPDIIVAISRGGLIPAHMLSEKFHVNTVYALRVKKIEGKRQVSTKILDDISGKKALLVEDWVSMGKSLSTGKKYLESRQAQVKTAALYSKPHAVVRPDYVVEVSDEVSFPWEVKE